MPENITNNRLGRDGQHFFINSTEVAGIQSVKVDYALTNTPFSYIGNVGTQTLPKGVSLGGLNVTSFLISDDQFLPLTGAAPSNFYIKRERNNFTSNSLVLCQSGVMVSYSTRYRLNQLPEINASFAIYGEISSNYLDQIGFNDAITIANSSSNATLKVIGPGCVTIALNNFQSNRILGYDITLNCPRNGIYEIGQTLLPKAIFSNQIEVNCSFDMEIDRYNLSPLRSSYVPGASDLTLTLKDFFSNDPVVSYNFSNLFLNSEVYNTTVDGNVTVSAAYKGFISR